MSYVLSTVAGNGDKASEDGIGTEARLHHPYAICQSADSQQLLFTEYGLHLVRRYWPSADERIPAIVTSLLMGGGGGGGGGGLPLPPLISIIIAYLMSDGTLEVVPFSIAASRSNKSSRI